MISYERLTAGWLLDGIQAVSMTMAPPTGFEFRGLLLEPGEDPIPQLGRMLHAPPHCLAVEAALAEVLADRPLHRYERLFSERVMLSLVRLLDYFGSPNAVLHLLVQLERGEFRKADSYLVERVAGVGGRQTERLRERFESALRRRDTEVWVPNLVLPFLQSEIEMAPTMWMNTAYKRADDLRVLVDTEQTNGLALVLGAFCQKSGDEAFLEGLANGELPRDSIALDLLFGEGEPTATLVHDPGPPLQFRERDYDLRIAVDFYERRIKMSDLLSRRRCSANEDKWSAGHDRLEKIEDWERALIGKSVAVERAWAA